ncbi:MAG: hypothetical protein HYV07_11750 [Deltaproteobacteria bacterium]|nr:hypothetical protein [Deltaproteobacteria bacterium]
MASLTLGAKLYAAFGASLLLFYLSTERNGNVFFGSDERTQAPKEARGSTGYRSHSFWHTGYQGGK